MLYKAYEMGYLGEEYSTDCM